MYKADIKEYSSLSKLVPLDLPVSCYPLSVTEGIQSGDVFTADGRQVLIWHKGGFAFLFGNYDDSVLDSVYDMLTDKSGTNARRFCLYRPIRLYLNGLENTRISRQKSGTSSPMPVTVLLLLHCHKALRSGLCSLLICRS